MKRLQFRQFVPSKVCLACDGCCRFREAQSAWRPKMSDLEKVAPATKKIFTARSIDDQGFITTVEHQDTFVCYFFNPRHNTCGIYSQRPFECRLYPFLLIKNKNGKGLAAHLNCPYIQEAWDSEPLQGYRKYLQEFFLRDEVLAFLKASPALFGDDASFTDEIEFLFPLAL
jgi:Fe-S-cluster containining protein